VPDDALDTAPRTPMAAVPGAVAVRPDGPPVAPRWAVCDEVTPGGELVGTTVIGGAVPQPAPPGDGVLLAGPDDSTWLVTAGHRHRVDTGDGRLRAAFGLANRIPRAVAADLLSVLPEGPALVTPDVPGRGRAAADERQGRIGDVLVAQPVGGVAQHFVVLGGGLQEVPAVVAELLGVASGVREARPIGADVLAAATFVDELQVAGWPAGSPPIREPVEAPVVCWTWSADGPQAGQVWMGSARPLPPDVSPVALAQADGAGERVDAVAVGAGGAVRATGPGRAAGAGPLWLVSATGVAHGVADDATAAALGITAVEPAPEAALRLLPTGPALDLAEAGRVVDVLAAG
jgi:type VII secretion protein EccB